MINFLNIVILQWILIRVVKDNNRVITGFEPTNVSPVFDFVDNRYMGFGNHASMQGNITGLEIHTKYCIEMFAIPLSGIVTKKVAFIRKPIKLLIFKKIKKVK